MRDKTQVRVIRIGSSLVFKMFAEYVRYQTPNTSCIRALSTTPCLLISHSSALGNPLLISLSRHDSGLSILLLESHLGLAILLLNESTKVPFLKALTIFFNRQSPT